ncbi:spondin-1-like isoform X2 [Pecten maximus]|uniref:spondin-1-like isoform X2 n=1 Tax=Pecten maximus TaxID=6579 RepID=UPI001458C9A0|nr:spondin-1-like isoform X2 [Pecten maximus]
MIVTTMKGIVSFINSLLITCALIGCYTPTHARSNLDVCERLPIHTNAPNAEGSGGFQILVKDLPEEGKYKPGEIYTVTINGTLPGNTVFLGFMMESVSEKNQSLNLGTFSFPRDGRVQKAPDCNRTVITHRYLMMKKLITVKWQAPPAASGCVILRSAVIETSDTWYKDDGKLTVRMCEEEVSTAPQGDGTVQDGESCCACGGATYNLHFKGLWSRQTHPKGFPEEEDELVLMHWSRLVGASHSSDYTIWEYGQPATEGVKELCEFGSSLKLQKEMRQNDPSIKTVIKTAPLWGYTQLRKTMNADFFVDQNAHYLSALSMIGPSPDWCVGVTRLNLCQTNCTWADQMEVDLFPWDAGTDSGHTYLARNIATNPKENIHKITNRYPRNPDSPFYGPERILPMARLRITKTAEQSCDDGTTDNNSGESAVSTSVLIERMKKKMMMKKKIADAMLQMEKCSTTEWTAWGSCNSTCGTGYRERRRLLNNLRISALACGIDLTQREVCEGDCRSSHRRKGPKELPDDYVIRHELDTIDLNDPCAVTQWSDWAPCSVTCGIGITERWRMFLWKNNSVQCQAKPRLMEKDLCFGYIRDCRKAIMMKNFSVICTTPVEIGPCKGLFPRWFYNSEENLCQPFNYGGCRGNENNFRSEQECTMTCDLAMASLNEGPTNEASIMRQGNVDMRPKLVVSSNKRGRKRKTSKREKKLMRKRKNKKARRLQRQRQRQRQREQGGQLEPPNDGPAINCQVTAWTDWSPCSVTCGKGFMMKTRSVEMEAQNGGRCSRRLSKKKKCRRPNKCPVDCVLSEWGEWTPCSHTCGDNAVQKRRKRVIKRPKRGGMDCPPRREKKFCILPVCPNTEEMEEMMRDALFSNPQSFP